MTCLCGIELSPLSIIHVLCLGGEAQDPMTATPQEAGLSKPVVGLVVPLGYSFNLDGTTLGALGAEFLRCWKDGMFLWR